MAHKMCLYVGRDRHAIMAVNSQRSKKSDTKNDTKPLQKRNFKNFEYLNKTHR